MQTLVFGSFQLIPERRLLLEDGKTVRLGSRALDILIVLTERAGQVVSKQELVARVWPKTIVEEANLRVHIGALRKVLGDGHAGARYVANVVGQGYCFVAPIERVAEEHRKTPAPSAVAQLATLPARLTRMIGRTEAVRALVEQVPVRRFVTIVGPGGIGKTTVALAVAEELLPTYEHGAHFVDLAALSDPKLAASALAAVLGVSIYTDNPLPGVLAFLADKQMLIVLDNCEHVVEAAANLAEQVLHRAPRAHIVATSRELLRADGEWVHRLASLESPPSDAALGATEALRYPAIQLFAERSMASSDTFELSDADVPSVADVCRRLDGIPLAIELAAAAVGLFGVRGVAARLDDHLSLLTRGRRTALPRHKTLRATLDWSYDILPAAEQVILRRLATFAARFTLESAAVIAAGGAIKVAEVADAVTNLVAKSLVTADISGEVVCYRLLDMTRSYALEKLRQSDELGEVFRRHARHCCDLLQRAESDWDVQSTKEWRATYGRRIDDVRVALEWAFSADGDPSAGVALTAASTQLWIELSRLDEHRQHLERALQSEPIVSGSDLAREMELNSALGNALFHTVGSTPAALRAFARALTLAEQLNDAPHRLRAFSGLCAEHLVSGDYPEAVAFAEKFKSALGDAASREAQIISDRLLGLSLHFAGEQSRARQLGERVLNEPVTTVHRTRTSGVQYDQRVAAGTLLSRTLWLQGFPERAMRVAEDAVEVAVCIDHAISLCYALAVAAYPIARWTGEAAKAERFLAMLLERSVEHSFVFWQSWAHGYERLKSGAGRRHASAEPPRVPVGPQLDVFATLNDERAVDAAIELAEKGRPSWCAPEMLRLKAVRILSAGGSRAAELAEPVFMQSLNIARRQESLSWELRTATSLARMWRDQRRVAEARDLLGSMYARFSEGFASSDLVAADALAKELARTERESA